jgi:hypothetical protein
MAETGSFAIVLPLLRVRFIGEYGGPFPTDTSNSHNARTRSARATVITTPNPAPPPAGRTFGVRYDKAIALDTPDMLDGRPT